MSLRRTPAIDVRLHAIHAMDESDAFYQQLDSEALLRSHGPGSLPKRATSWARAPDARVAGLITTPDSCNAAAVREMLAKATGSALPLGLLVGLVPRQAVERLLASRVDDSHWREASWQPQGVLPIVVSTRDGFRFGFSGLEPPDRSGE